MSTEEERKELAALEEKKELEALAAQQLAAQRLLAAQPQVKEELHCP